MTGMSMLRSAIAAILAAAAVVLVAFVLGAIPLGWALLFGLIGGALALVAAMLTGSTEPNWAPAPEPVQSATVMQASTLTARLSEAATDDYRYHTRIQPRLRKLALGTLRQRPELRDLTDLADPRVRALLGDELHTMLTARGGVLPTPRRITRLLARLEEP
ncbi:hypothetical protein [Labedaea rhizosphaerae]|uniref:Uncharacterized protein n=1 Tax=Labedaea rhizosphaerae TaxID=598644 RepID=A0A4V3D033_LABRH|nr:hypothetical protein [Labedaea rhizosphaerae]TDQ04245.1 hypothetical protein EV186_101188 [Labedaea rhizosphaerae]